MQPENLKRTNRLTNKAAGIDPRAYNAIANGFAGDRGHTLQENGYAYSNNLRASKQRIKYRKQFYFQCEFPLPERSIFGIAQDPFDEQLFNDPCIVDVVNINAASPASVFGLFTNLQAYNPDDSFGICKAIDYYEPTLLFVSDSANIPQVGFPCGPDDNEDGWGISGYQSFGLICISLPDDNFNVWCVRTSDCVSILGTVINNNINVWTGGINPLPTGQIQVQYRSGNASNLDQLLNATGPNELPLQLPVFNISQTSTFTIGQQVKCIAVSGIGLVIIDQANLLKGRAVANIEHYTSGLVNIYTGNPGAESWDGQTTALAFNHVSEIVRNEWVFLTASGSTTTPYYIINNEYSGKILGKAKEDYDGSPSAGIIVELYAGDPGSEIDIGESVIGFPRNNIGAIPIGSWVICNFVAGDVNEVGYWQIIQSQQGNSFAAKVTEGSADPSTGYADVDTNINVELYKGISADQDTGIEVQATIKYRPVCENEWVQVEFNGDIFIITRGELDGGFYAVAQQGQINNGGTGFVVIKPMANSNVSVTSLKVDTQEGNVEQGRTVWVSGNRGGFHIVSKSCN